MLVKLSQTTIRLEDAKTAVHHPSCGAIAFFEGTIRRTNDGKDVTGLEYQVYDAFFYSEVGRIAEEIKAQWAIHEIAFLQRVGRLDIGESGIIIAVSSIHRRDALQAVDYAIEQFKKRAPVWKKEFYPDSAEWIVCHHGNYTPSL